MSKRISGGLLDVPSEPSFRNRLSVLDGDCSLAPRPHIGPVPKSSLLTRLNQFLPELQAANQQLNEELKIKPPSHFDVENVPEDQEGGYIEMDLACGLIDLKSEEAVIAAETAMKGHGRDLPRGTDMSVSEDSSGEDSDDAEEGHVGPSNTTEVISNEDSMKMGRAESNHHQQSELPTQTVKKSALNSSKKKRRDRPSIVEL
ncbi:hypothetical protein CEUSTIGMA_g9653.t1 [Chlamydomonas eustigma]|uniref:Uncharacterized protein n=1 Tax=Chlamydomonas eustigma TaxID=1157962 RepID=A0A250XGL7_9CHLO|nr:hypothetical protein CEUSTIGMA_g9653.t1 [Chlamydomonas eustigma]|eukprot:GAX82225.1 hypothetical protein CEUSTIGMA_g9653.t1 [Chlamydomonas eustigma]